MLLSYKVISVPFFFRSVFSNPPFFFNADTEWVPKPAVVQGTQVVFMNIDGLLFYTDDRRLRNEIASIATLATVATLVRQNATKIGTRLGVGAALQAAISKGITASISANTARLQAAISSRVRLAFGLF
jgi:hypothetical protein